MSLSPSISLLMRAVGGVRALLICILITLSLSGCGVTQEKVDRQLDEILTDEKSVAPTNWAAQSGESVYSVDWVASFSDEKLQALVDEAIANNLNLAVSAATVASARAMTQHAGAALLPSVDISGSSRRDEGLERGNSAATSVNADVQISWELDLWGRLESGRRAAIANQQAVEADYRYSRHSLAAATIKAYLTAVEARQQIEHARESVTLLEQTLRIINVRYRNGMSYSQDVALAKANVAAARESLVTVEGSYRDAVRALELLLGRYPKAEAEISNALPVSPGLPPVGLPSEMLERRPDIIAAERRVAAAFNVVNQAKAAHLPTLALTGSLGGSSGSLSNLLGSNNLAWMAGSSLLAPIFDGGRRRAQVKVSSAEQKQALANYGQTVLTAFSEVESALDQSQVAAGREAYLVESHQEFAEAYRIARLRYDEGESELIDVLAIQQQLIGAQRSLASIRRIRLQLQVDLHLALGGRY